MMLVLSMQVMCLAANVPFKYIETGKMVITYRTLLVDMTAGVLGHPSCAMDEPETEGINQILSLQGFGDSIDRDLEVLHQWEL